MACIWTRWASRSHPVGWCHQERRGFPLVIALLPLPSTILQTQLGPPVCKALHAIWNQKDGNCKACLISAGGHMVDLTGINRRSAVIKGISVCLVDLPDPLLWCSWGFTWGHCNAFSTADCSEKIFLSCYAGVWRLKRFCSCLQQQRLWMPACLQSYYSRAFCADFWELWVSLPQVMITFVLMSIISLLLLVIPYNAPLF